MRRIMILISACAMSLVGFIGAVGPANAAATDPSSLYYAGETVCGPNKCWTDASGNAITGKLSRRDGDQVRIYNRSGADIYINYTGVMSGYTLLANNTDATFAIGGTVNKVQAYPTSSFGSYLASIDTETPPDLKITGSAASTVLSVTSLNLAVGDTFMVQNGTADNIDFENASGSVIKMNKSCTPANVMYCRLIPGMTNNFTVGSLGTVKVGSATLTIGTAPSPSPASGKPGTPGKPTAVAGTGAATVSVVAPSTGGTPTSYTVTSSPDAKTCTVTVPATSCEVTGLTNGKAYTFTATATNADGTSDASAASDAVTPDLKPNTPTAAPEYAKTSSIARPGVTVLLKKGVMTPSGEIATPRVRFVEYVQGVRPRGDVVSTKLGTYKVTKTGRVIVNVLSKQPMTIIMTLRAPATTEYKAYRQVKTWTLK